MHSAAKHIFSRAAVNQHPAEVLAYAGRHDYADLMDEAAPLCILASVDMGRMLSCTTLVAWVGLNPSVRTVLLTNEHIRLDSVSPGKKSCLPHTSPNHPSTTMGHPASVGYCATLQSHTASPVRRPCSQTVIYSDKSKGAWIRLPDHVKSASDA